MVKSTPKEIEAAATVIAWYARQLEAVKPAAQKGDVNAMRESITLDSNLKNAVRTQKLIEQAGK